MGLIFIDNQNLTLPIKISKKRNCFSLFSTLTHLDLIRQYTVWKCWWQHCWGELVLMEKNLDLESGILASFWPLLLIVSRSMFFFYQKKRISATSLSFPFTLEISSKSFGNVPKTINYWRIQNSPLFYYNTKEFIPLLCVCLQFLQLYANKPSFSFRLLDRTKDRMAFRSFNFGVQYLCITSLSHRSPLSCN